MKILVLPKYHWEGSSSRYRYYNYFEWFSKENFIITCRPLLYNGYVKDLYHSKKRVKRIIMTGIGIFSRLLFLSLNRKKYDIIIIEKELVTFMPFFLEKFLLRGTRFIADYDDNINARYQTGWSKWFLSEKIMHIAGLANAITVGNHWYMEFYKNIDPSKVHYLPTVIDREYYAQKQAEKQEHHQLKIVWIGSPGNIKYLKSIDAILHRLQSEYHFILKVIGAKIEMACAAEFIEWNAATEIEELKQCDIGVMPLENTDWEKGKCGFKLIQYMACGLPVVAAYSVANNEIVDPACGFIAKTTEDWLHSLSELLQSADLRKQMGDNGRKRIYEQYSYQAWAPVFINLLRNINSAVIN